MAERFSQAEAEESYLQAAPPPTLYPGLARYLRKSAT
jgi:hypothetical protein